MDRAITNEMLLQAAEAHAFQQLGELQFKKNKDAVKSIASDFIDGAKYILSELEDKGDLVNLVDKCLEYENS